MSDLFNNKNYLFVLANPGAGGHRLGRIISCFNTVYWYSSLHNGSNPWDIFFDNTVTGKSISAYHYDRTFINDTVPLLGERILKWWNPEDYDSFYQNNWSQEMQKISLPKDQLIHWILHDRPEDLHFRFPNAKIISLIDTDLDLVTDRYMQTTANFPCAVKHFNLKPGYKNQYAECIDKLGKPTEQQLWFDSHKNSNFDDYYTHIKNSLTLMNNIRLSYKHENHLCVTWNQLDIERLKIFLNATNIDTQFKLLV